MPDKPLEKDKSPWINYMRAEKKHNPIYEHLSRKEYYPIASRGYAKWKRWYGRNYHYSEKNLIQSLKDFFNLKEHQLKKK
jgi:hypothetical protein